MFKTARVAFAGFAALALGLWPRSAETCGMFVAAPRVQVPSLAVEQTLLVFDHAKELEHFIRQVAIRNPSPGFGFVVPVPEQPEVAAVKQSPFEKLAKRYPLETPGMLHPGMGGGGLGLGVAAAVPSVKVLSTTRVGSFTAFVLAANDATGLKKWLDQHHLTTTPDAEAWFAHYVKLGFYYAALRYEAPPADAKAPAKDTTRAETIRITFHTPLPFYPYREPHHAASPNDDEERDLAVWLVSAGSYVPVSLFRDAASATWKRPLLQHYLRAETRDALAEVVGSEIAQLLPPAKSGKQPGEPGTLSVQVFEDQKRSREGWSDIVMVHQHPESLSGATPEQERKLMASLDPTFGGEP